jgi:hypothetical protein
VGVRAATSGVGFGAGVVSGLGDGTAGIAGGTRLGTWATANGVGEGLGVLALGEKMGVAFAAMGRGVADGEEAGTGGAEGLAGTYTTVVRGVGVRRGVGEARRGATSGVDAKRGDIGRVSVRETERRLSSAAFPAIAADPVGSPVLVACGAGATRGAPRPVTIEENPKPPSASTAGTQTIAIAAARRRRRASSAKGVAGAKEGWCQSGADSAGGGGTTIGSPTSTVASGS